ncbi:hypothetical protein JW756_01775 [Candidatus Woesearchaeota archaeon]|nr:hypothetical protein [Candidatus Woesearchaeota archaeon]
MRRLKSKLAQSATQAGVVIILIAVLIIFYLLFMAPEDRAKLLGEDISNGNGGVPSGVKSTLFSQVPGRIYPLTSNLIEHTMPSFMVFTVTNAGELKRVDSLYIKNSAFSDSAGEVIFFYDAKTTNDVKLSFNIKKHSGRLIIKLNNNQLFDGEITETSPPPISLPSEYLQSRNVLTFTASEVGAAFWRVNEYELENVLVSAKITDYSGAFAEQHFSITPNEYDYFDKAVFDFLPDCPPRDEGLVQILINNRAIYTSYPDCGVKSRIEISKELLKPGDNTLVATTNSGAFLIDMPKIIIIQKEMPQPIFYFNVPNTLYDALYYGQRGLVLTLRFADAGSVKRGTLEVNDFKTFFEIQDIAYQTPIDPEFIVAGPNSVKITPQSDPIDMTELRMDVI